MERSRAWWLVLSIIILVFTTGGICRGEVRTELSAKLTEDSFSYRLGGEYDLGLPDPWTLTLAGALPQPADSDNPVFLKLSLEYGGERWNWSGDSELGTTGTRTWFQLGLGLDLLYDQLDWKIKAGISGTKKMASPDGDLKLTTSASYDAGRNWRWRSALDLSWVTSYDGRYQYQQQALETHLTWQVGGRRLELAWMGTSSRGDPGRFDYLHLMPSLTWSMDLPGTWSLDGELKLRNFGEPTGTEAGGDLNLSLSKKSMNLRLQARYDLIATSSARTPNVTVGLALGKSGDLFWKTGLVVRNNPSPGADVTALYATGGYEHGPWRLDLGVAPDGQFASKGERGYWLEISYSF